MTNQVLPRSCSGVRRGERLTNCIGAWQKGRYTAFTLIELIVVVGIITILAGLVLSTVGYAKEEGRPRPRRNRNRRHVGSLRKLQSG